MKLSKRKVKVPDRGQAMKQLASEARKALSLLTYEQVRRSYDLLPLIREIGGMRWVGDAAITAIKIIEESYSKPGNDALCAVAMLTLEEFLEVVADESRGKADSVAIKTWAQRAFLFSLIKEMHTSSAKRAIAESSLPRQLKRAAGARDVGRSKRAAIAAAHRKFIRVSHDTLIARGKLPKDVAQLIFKRGEREGLGLSLKTVRNEVSKIRKMRKS